MGTQLTTILGVALVGAAIVVVQSRGRTNADASTSGTGAHRIEKAKRLSSGRGTPKPSKSLRVSQRVSIEELIRQAESLRVSRKYEAALEVATLAVNRAPNGEAVLPSQLRGLLRVLQGEPQYVGVILTTNALSGGGIFLNTEQTPAKLITPIDLTPPDVVTYGPSFMSRAPSPILVRPDSVKNLGDFREGDVVKVWASGLMLSNPPQVDALRIEKVK